MASDRSAEQLRAIIRTETEIATSDLEPEAIMQLIAERARELTGASAGVIAGPPRGDGRRAQGLIAAGPSLRRRRHRDARTAERADRRSYLSSQAARIAAERIAAEIHDANLDDGELGASFGIASGAEDEAALLAAADRELLAATDQLYGCCAQPSD